MSNAKRWSRPEGAKAGLFLGGPKDGQMLAEDHPSTHHSVAYTRGPIMLYGKAPAHDAATIERFTYRRVDIGPMIFWVPERVFSTQNPLEYAMDRLVSCYRPWMDE